MLLCFHEQGFETANWLTANCFEVRRWYLLKKNLEEVSAGGAAGCGKTDLKGSRGSLADMRE
jgi:hypothetical protein